MKRPHEYKIVSLRECEPTATVYDQPEPVAEYWRQNIASQPSFNGDVENLAVILLNTRHRVTGHTLIGMGGLDNVNVHAREAFRAAIIGNAYGIVLAHNHPSGDSTPSDADIKVTRDLIKAGQLLKVQLLDHIVMGKPGTVHPTHPGWTSLRQMGYFAW